MLDMMGLNLPHLAFKGPIPLLVLGAEKDAFLPPSVVEWTGHLYDAPSHVFPKTAHAMMLENNWKEIADYIITWLEKTIPVEKIDVKKEVKPVVEEVKKAVEPVAEKIATAVKPAVEAAKPEVKAAESKPVVEEPKKVVEPVAEKAVEAVKPAVKAAKPEAAPSQPSTTNEIQAATETASTAKRTTRTTKPRTTASRGTKKTSSTDNK